MLSANWIPGNRPRKHYGFRVFVASCIFSAVTIALVLWDNHSQRKRRQVGVKERLKTIQQQENMKQYQSQQQLYERYKDNRY